MNRYVLAPDHKAATTHAQAWVQQCQLEDRPIPRLPSHDPHEVRDAEVLVCDLLWERRLTARERADRDEWMRYLEAEPTVVHRMVGCYGRA